MKINLFKYMPSQYLKTTLENGIFFSLAKGYLKGKPPRGDKMEGFLSKDSLKHLDGRISRTMAQMNIQPSHGDITRTRKVIYKELVKRCNKDTFLSCWNEGDHPSKAMWDGFSKNGIYIKTNTWDLSDSIERDLCPLLSQSNQPGLPLLSKVNYVDSLQHMPMEEEIERLINLDFHSHKRNIYAYQNEQRLKIDIYHLAQMLQLRIGKVGYDRSLADLKVEAKGRVKFLHSDYSTTEDAQSSKKVIGIFLQADPVKLITEIGMVGRGNFYEVASLCERFQLPPPVVLKSI